MNESSGLFWHNTAQSNTWVVHSATAKDAGYRQHIIYLCTAAMIWLVSAGLQRSPDSTDR